jgi:hypothetical protein
LADKNATDTGDASIIACVSCHKCGLLTPNKGIEAAIARGETHVYGEGQHEFSGSRNRKGAISKAIERASNSIKKT